MRVIARQGRDVSIPGETAVNEILFEPAVRRVSGVKLFVLGSDAVVSKPQRTPKNPDIFSGRFLCLVNSKKGQLCGVEFVDRFGVVQPTKVNLHLAINHDLVILLTDNVSICGYCLLPGLERGMFEINRPLTTKKSNRHGVN